MPFWTAVLLSASLFFRSILQAADRASDVGKTEMESLPMKVVEVMQPTSTPCTPLMTMCGLIVIVGIFLCAHGRVEAAHRNNLLVGMVVVAAVVFANGYLAMVTDADSIALKMNMESGNLLNTIKELEQTNAKLERTILRANEEKRDIVKEMNVEIEELKGRIQQIQRENKDMILQISEMKLGTIQTMKDENNETLQHNALMVAMQQMNQEKQDHAMELLLKGEEVYRWQFRFYSLMSIVVGAVLLSFLGFFFAWTFHALESKVQEMEQLKDRTRWFEQKCWVMLCFPYTRTHRSPFWFYCLRPLWPLQDAERMSYKRTLHIFFLWQLINATHRWKAECANQGHLESVILTWKCQTC